jgi:hypothetical protein
MFDKLFSLIRLEPVMVVTALIIALTAAQTALGSGLDLQAAGVAAIQALLGYLARQLVTPTAKA